MSSTSCNSCRHVQRRDILPMKSYRYMMKKSCGHRAIRHCVCLGNYRYLCFFRSLFISLFFFSLFVSCFSSLFLVSPLSLSLLIFLLLFIFHRKWLNKSTYHMYRLTRRKYRLHSRVRLGVLFQRVAESSWEGRAYNNHKCPRALTRTSACNFEINTT